MSAEKVKDYLEARGLADRITKSKREVADVIERVEDVIEELEKSIDD